MKRTTFASVCALLVLAAGSLSACQGNATAHDSDVLNSMRATKEQQRQIYDCVKESGWDVSFDDASGTFVADVPDAQADAYSAALKKCSDRLGLTFNTPPNGEQLKAVYRWYVEIATCLKRHDWPTPSTPSFASFSDTYDTDPWIPWISVPASKISDATNDCPVISEGSGLGH